jgi:hypothetical protein
MSRKISAQSAHVALPLLAFSLALGLIQACGSGGGAFSSGSAGADGGSLLVPDPGARAGDAGDATPAGGATAGDGATSAGGACSGANCGVPGPGKVPGTTCANPDECQSGRCEPTTGMSGEACLAACFSDGVACTRALDCCSTGCTDGKCGGQCTVVGDPCKVNAECCSNVCEAGECQVDMPNRDCRPAGEDCGKGSGSGCCNICDKKTGRCDFGPDTCFAQGVACTATAQCCHGECLTGKCAAVCVAQAGACAADADCCSVSCVGGKCQAPTTGVGGSGGAGTVATCVLTGDACTAGPACCSGFCLGGFCEAPIR